MEPDHEVLKLENFLCWIEAHPGLAGWLQAFFSVVAIGVSGFFPMWISSRERKKRKQHQRERVAILIDRLLTMFKSLAATVSDSLRAEMFKHERTVEDWRQEDLIISGTPADDSFSDDIFLLIALRTSSAVGLDIAESLATADPYLVDHGHIRIVGEQIEKLELLQRTERMLRTGIFADGTRAR